MTVDHFGSGGRRSDSRLGRRGKNLGESGKVAKSWILKFLDFSWISFFEKMRKITIRVTGAECKVPNAECLECRVQNQSWGLWNRDLRIFSNKEINEKSRNFRNHDFATFPLSHFPTFREFFPPAPQPRIWAAAAWSEMIDRHELFVHFSVHSLFENVRQHSRPFSFFYFIRFCIFTFPLFARMRLWWLY